MIALDARIAFFVVACAAAVPSFAQTPAPPASAAADLGPFPYLRWPADFTPQNTPTDEGFGHFLFWDGKQLRNVEGRTFRVTLVAAQDRGRFNEYLIRRKVEADLARMGAVRAAAGKIPNAVLGTMTDVDRQSLGDGLGDVWNDPVQTWVVREPGREVWFQFTDNSAEASLAVVETQAR